MFEAYDSLYLPKELFGAAKKEYHDLNLYMRYK